MAMREELIRLRKEKRLRELEAKAAKAPVQPSEANPEAFTERLKGATMRVGSALAGAPLEGQPASASDVYTIAQTPQKVIGAVGKKAQEMIPEFVGGPSDSTALNVLKGTPRAMADIVTTLGEDQTAPESLAIMALGGPLMKGASKAVKPLGKPLAKLASATTGVDASKFARLFNDPMAIFASKATGKKKFVEGIEKATEKIGGKIKPTTVKNLDELAEGATKSTGSMLKEITSKIDLKTATPLDALEGRQLVDEVLRGLKPNTERYENAMELRKVFDAMVKESADLAAGDAAYARGALGSTFRNILPVTKKGGTSIMRTALMGALASGAGLPGAAALASPALAGGATSLASLAGKALSGSVKTPLRRAILGSIVGKESR